ncbi:MAG: cellulase family glycosylhydrolase [Treponema sp.]|nr:cellulase family glycosylhydrolase [Treponema sp.]
MRINNNFIIDDDGRTLILRGVNLGGDSKIPFCEPGEEINSDFLNTNRNDSFIGRPFPVEEAESHFRRLKKAGMTFLRLIVTWEAIEHQGPGIYDEAYLAYLRKILLAAEKEGISVFIDPHQDVWSRWTGGDGAPAWTLEKLGINVDNIDRCAAGITRQRYSLYHKSKKFPDGDPFPKMIWPSNYNRYATATMFSLFFAGNAYAPDLKIDGENVQDYFQNRHIAAYKHMQRRLKNCAAIKGWSSMNEPHFGFIGHNNLENSEDPLIPIGVRPSPWQTMRAASGYSVSVPVIGVMDAVKNNNSAGKKHKYEIFNPDKISLFKEGFSCPWKQAGIWKEENGAPKLLKKDHFSQYQGRKVNFSDDFLKPFIVKYFNALKEANENTLFFIEGIPKSQNEDSHPSWNKDDPVNTVNSFHWYDGFSLFTKRFFRLFTMDPDTAKFIIGKKKINRFFAGCLAKGIHWTKKKMSSIPSLLGEFGLAFDINNKSGFRTGNYKLHEEALSRNYDAIDANLLHSTIWNYTASNTNKFGDGWNDEDLSIFSEGKERAAAGWKRPYPMATAGKPLAVNWNRKRRVFTFSYNADNSIKAPTIIFLPSDTFGASPKISINVPLKHEYKHDEQQLLVYNNDYNGEVNILIKK